MQIRTARGTTDAAEMYGDGTYLQNNATWHTEDSPWKAEQVRTILARNNIRPTTVCEVGCGAGEILKQLSLRMTDTFFVGYELSPQAFELSRTRECARVKFQLGNILDENVFFDSLLCIDVFEHVEDYIGFIRALKSKATYKVFHIPLDISVLAVLRGSLMKARETVGHLHHFTTETALATLTDSGYEIVDHFYTTCFEGLPHQTAKARLARYPRRLLYALSRELMVKLLGGCSLMVLSK